MIHPHTKLAQVSEKVGLGVFATQLIPKGTIVYVLDKLDIIIPASDRILQDDVYKEYLEKYSYIDENGDSIICWDHGKYVNHCCAPSTLTTGYGFEIAIRDIFPGEEITDDYLLLNTEEEMFLNCPEKTCRKKLSLDDFDLLTESWDGRIKSALENVNKVEQPLWSLLDKKTLFQLKKYTSTGEEYVSVKKIKFQHA